jgi:hypothetical protein
MQISLDLRNENLSEKRIHQICAWKPARCRSGERSLALAIGDGCGDLLVLPIAVSYHFDCCRIVIFFSPSATTAEV